MRETSPVPPAIASVCVTSGTQPQSVTCAVTCVEGERPIRGRQGFLRHADLKTALQLYALSDRDETRAGQGQFLSAMGITARVQSCGWEFWMPFLPTRRKEWRGRRDSNPRPLP
jgi:hypothetical protein